MSADPRALLATYTPSPDEAGFQSRFEALFSCLPASLYRTHFIPGHVTGSALLVSPCGDRVLLNHHRALNKWLCFGGHADGDADIFAVARREVEEESGIGETDLPEGQNEPRIHDIDIHLIPASEARGEPSHLHYDIRFVLRARHERFTLSDESLALRWCGFDEAPALVSDASMRRLIRKAHTLMEK